MRSVALVSVIAPVLLGTLLGASIAKVGPLNPSGIAVPEIAQETAVVTDSSGKCGFVAFTGISSDLNQSQVYFVAVPSSGQPGRPQVVTPPRSGSPSLVRTGETLHITWLEVAERKKFRVGYRRSSDQGANWSEPVYVDGGISSRKPLLASGPGGSLFILFISAPGGSNQPDTIWCYRSGDQGNTWQRESPEEKVGGMLSELSPVAAPRALNLAWVETRPQGFNVMFNRAVEGEKSWLSQPAIVCESPLPVSQLHLSACGSDLILFWKESAADGDQIRCASSQNGGSAWNKPVEIHAKRVRQLTYQVLVKADNARVVSVEETSAGRDRRFHFTVKQLELSKLPESSGVVSSTVTTWTNTYLYRPEFLTATKGEELLIVAAVREPTKFSSLFLIPPNKTADDGVLPIFPEEGEMDRTLIALVGLSDGVGVLYRQQPRRRLPQEDWPGELIFTRIPLTN